MNLNFGLLRARPMVRTRRNGFRKARLLTFVTCALASTIVAVVAQPAHAAGPVASRYYPVTPVRVMDTREGLGGTRLPAGGSTTLKVITDAVASASGVSSQDVTAVVINLTSVDAAGPGYVTAWPAGQPQPATSSLNPSAAGQTLANLVTVPVGPGGAIALFSLTGGDLVVDIQGVYAASGPTVAGRLEVGQPRRVFDSRQFNLGLSLRPFRPGESFVMEPLSYTAVAYVLNVTVTEATGPGFITVWPSGQPRPLASNLNVERRGQTIANQVITAVTAGQYSVYSQGGGHIVVDLIAMFSGNEDFTFPSTAGLFVPVTPTRLIDTRDVTSSSGVSSRPTAGATIEVQPAGLAGLPTNAEVGAVALNVTLSESALPGYVTAWPARTSRPLASALNADRADQTISNHAVAAVSNSGFSLFTQNGAHLIADITGYWTGESVLETEFPPYQPTPGGIVAQPPSPPATGPHAFFHEIFNGNDIVGYARWDPCLPIRYLVNDDLATPAQRALLDLAIRDLEGATGLDFIHVGETSQGHNMRVPANSVGARTVITFSNPELSAGRLGFDGLHTVAGLANGTLVGTEAVEGAVLIDVSNGEQARMHHVLIHELAHLVGLDHIETPDSVMNATTPDSGPFPTTFGNGDREGLWRLGAAQGCLQSN